ncbi:hypothetical protein ACSBR1_033976 [Camellia fascicularis]
MECLGREILKELWGGWFVDWMYLPTLGVARGVLLCWDRRAVVKEEEEGIPWCVGGNFNVVRSLEEKLGATPLVASIQAFSSLIDDLALVDLPLQGGAYTWSGGGVMSCLDKFLVKGEWEEHFSQMTQIRLSCPVSDHWPVLLDSRGIRSRPVPFRFENMWLQSKGFKERVKGWCVNYSVSGLPSCRLAQKLKLLKTDLKMWNREVFGRLEVQKVNVLAVL